MKRDVITLPRTAMAIEAVLSLKGDALPMVGGDRIRLIEAAHVILAIDHLENDL